MMMKEANPQSQLCSIKNIRRLIGSDNINAVKNESWRGEMFLGESMECKLLVSGCQFLVVDCVE